MNLVEIAQSIGIYPKRVASTRGGEYHSPCPNCGGKDRFIIQPNHQQKNCTGAFHCRQCKIHGDAIQFCREFLNLDFEAACDKLQVEIDIATRLNLNFPRFPSLPPSTQWRERGIRFVQYCHQHLLKNSRGMDFLKKRGLSLETANRYLLGWNPYMLLDAKQMWDLPITYKDGKKCSQWLPQGFVVPTFQHGKLVKIKVRRSNYREDDKLPKYVEISGSMKAPSFFGDMSKPIVLVEAEIDAILIQQEAGELCYSLALGGASKKPDEQTHEFLMKAKLILFALDYDEAGKKAYRFWRETYPALRPFPAPREKSPGDAYLAGLNLHQWIEAGLTKHL